MNEPKTSYLDQVQLYSFPKVIALGDHYVYHDLLLYSRLQSNVRTIAEGSNLDSEELETILVANWLHGTIIKDTKVEIEEDTFVVKQNPAALAGCKEFLRQIGYPEKKIEGVAGILEHVVLTLPPRPENPLEEIYADALIMDFVGKNGRRNLNKAYEEILLQEVEVSKKDWYDMVLGLLTSFSCFTRYGKENIEPQIIELQLKLQKDKKDLLKRKDLILKKELDISEEELKKLKKELSAVTGRDERGIQTLFRTTSKNHYILKDMVDRKASIMITVNSIILSLVVGGFIGNMEIGPNLKALPSFILTVSCAISIIYAVLAIRPNKTQGEFTEEEIRSKQGNLLYFGNFHNMQFRDYEWGMLQMLRDRNYLYSALIRDIYYLGQILHRKYNLIRISLNVFLIGFVLTIITTLLTRIFT